MKIDRDVIEKLFEDSKSNLKEEYESFISKIKKIPKHVNRHYTR